MDSNKASRRLFLKNSAALAGVALGARSIASGQANTGSGPSPSGRTSNDDWRAYGQRSQYDSALRYGSNHSDDQPFPPGRPRDLGYRSPLQDITGFITPAPLHYMITHGQLARPIDPREHRFMLHGMVDRPVVFTMDELR